jgi:hypothetical protein
VTANPTNLTALSDVPAKAVTIRRIHRSTSSDSAGINRRKPRSPSVGIHSTTRASIGFAAGCKKPLEYPVYTPAFVA